MVALKIVGSKLLAEKEIDEDELGTLGDSTSCKAYTVDGGGELSQQVMKGLKRTFE